MLCSTIGIYIYLAAPLCLRQKAIDNNTSEKINKNKASAGIIICEKRKHEPAA